MGPFPVTLVYNPRNLGKLANIDRVYELVRTEFLMHMDDDMEFVRLAKSGHYALMLNDQYVRQISLD